MGGNLHHPSIQIRMTTAELAIWLQQGYCVCLLNEDVIPNNIFFSETRDALLYACDEVTLLKKQRNELAELMPQNATKYKEQFNEQVLRVARELQEKLECTT